MLKITDLHVFYGAFQALMGINLEVGEGEIVALLGGNGAGKSTTINSVSGLVHPRSGSIEYMGKDISKVSVFKRVEMGLVQVPEGRKLFPAMTVQDNMLIGSYLKHARAKRKETMDLCFEMFPKLYERRSQQAGSLSGGEQQMCAIARALMEQPKLLMMDEPSLGLAPVVVQDMFEIIKKISRMGMSILLVEQNVSASLDIADRAYVIETGMDVMNGSAQELANNEDMKRAYLGL